VTGVLAVLAYLGAGILLTRLAFKVWPDVFDADEPMEAFGLVAFWPLAVLALGVATLVLGAHWLATAPLPRGRRRG
jgi:hypothetical protein